MTTENLIRAIQDGKSAEIQDSFDAIMNDKLVRAIDAYREAVVEDAFSIAELDEATAWYPDGHEGNAERFKSLTPENHKKAIKWHTSQAKHFTSSAGSQNPRHAAYHNKQAAMHRNLLADKE